MVALLVAASVLPLGISAYADYFLTKERLQSATEDLLAARGDQLAGELDNFHRSYQRSAVHVSRLPDSMSYCTAGGQGSPALSHNAQLGLEAYLEADAAIRGIALLDKTGTVVVATEPNLLRANLAKRPSVSLALQGKAVIADLYVSTQAQAEIPTIGYLHPVIGDNGKVTCVVGLWVHASAFWDTVKASDALAGASSFAMVLDQDGILIGHSSSGEMIFHPAGPLEASLVEHMAAGRRFGARTRALLEDVRPSPQLFERARARGAEPSVFRERASASGAWNYGVARRLQSVSWTVFYMVPETSVVDYIAKATRGRIVIALAIMAAAGLVGAAFAATILNPIRRLSKAAVALAGGDLTARVSEPRRDELGQFGAHFNRMADQIEAHAQSRQRAHDELERRVHERTAELKERDAALHRAHVMARLGHVITRPDGSFESWSDTIPELIGKAPQSVPASTREWMKWIAPEDRTKFREASLHAARTGLGVDVQYRLQRGDGEWVVFRQVIEPLPGQSSLEGGMRWFSTIQDITEQEKASQDLRLSEEHTRLIIDTALDAVVTMDSAGRITGWSPQAEATFGWTREEVMGRSLASTIVPHRYREAHERGIAHYLATGIGPVLNKRVELAALHKNGHELPIDLAITPIRTASSVSFSAFARDITERKENQQRLQAHLERLMLLDQVTHAIGERQDLQSIYQVAIRSLEDNMPVDFACICRHDAGVDELVVIRVGAKSHDLAEALALAEQSRIPIDLNGLSRAVRGEMVYEPDVSKVAFPLPQRLAEGGFKSVVFAPLQSESRVFGVLLVARRAAHAFSSGDSEFLRQLSSHVALAAQQAELHEALLKAYDELRRSQQTVLQQERLRALGQMASGIAHDINNALSPVALYTESLLERETGLSERGRGYLTTISQAIEDVAETVARMREFYRPREQQMALTTVRMNELVRQVTELTRARWSDIPLQQGVVIQWQTELAEALPTFHGVESEVREALINLVFNAVDAMPQGGALTLRTSSQAADPRHGIPEGRVAVEVVDSGMGMDEETRRRCLEPFFTTKGERVTGLGLAMVYGIAERHAAKIDIDSTPGQGTRVKLSFPVPLSTQAEQESQPPVAAPIRRMRLLLVDDDPVILKSLRESLELDGHAVVVAGSGRAGIEAFLQEATSGEGFDIVITDLGMPHVDGREVAAAVKKSERPVAVILLTGWGQRLLADGETPVHVDQILSKPPKLREVRAALARWGNVSDTGRPS
jgi:PAS domain S-box-containing protein